MFGPRECAGRIENISRIGMVVASASGDNIWTKRDADSDTRLLIASKLIIGGQSSWRSPALRSLAAKVHFDNFDRQQFDPCHNNAIIGGKSSFWSSTIRSFADNLHFDHNRRQLDPLRRTAKVDFDRPVIIRSLSCRSPAIRSLVLGLTSSY